MKTQKKESRIFIAHGEGLSLATLKNNFTFLYFTTVVCPQP